MISDNEEADIEGVIADEFSVEEHECINNIWEYISSTHILGFGEEELQEVLNCDVDVPVTNTLSDSEIIDMALNRTDSDEECDMDDAPEEKKLT